MFEVILVQTTKSPISMTLEEVLQSTKAHTERSFKTTVRPGTAAAIGDLLAVRQKH